MRRIVFTAALFFLALAPGCGGGSSAPVNTIKIENITPASARFGESTTFAITASYDLQTAYSAVIDYCFSEGFFSDRPPGCTAPITSAGITVNRGRGTITIKDTRILTETSRLSLFLFPIQDSNTENVASDVKEITVVP
jgi:hypothetical protein